MRLGEGLVRARGRLDDGQEVRWSEEVHLTVKSQKFSELDIALVDVKLVKLFLGGCLKYSSL